MSTDDKGFQVRNSETPDQQAQLEAQQAAMDARNVAPKGIGRDNNPPGVDLARLSDHQYDQAHKAELLAQLAAEQLPGQPGHAADPA